MLITTIDTAIKHLPHQAILVLHNEKPARAFGGPKLPIIFRIFNYGTLA